jgi:hypothetical protein
MKLELTVCTSSGEKVHELANLVQAITEAEIAMNDGALYISIRREGSNKPDLERWSDAATAPFARA